MRNTYRYVKISFLVFLLPFISVANNVIKPYALHKGDTVALLASASAASDDEIKQAIDNLQSLGLKVKLGEHVGSKYQDGYFSAKAKYRAKDLNKAFANSNIKAIFEVRGGWGSAQLLPLLDYSVIKKNPKAIVGFSDITSLLLAINKKTGLITFHGPVAMDLSSKFSIKYMEKVLFDSKTIEFKSSDSTTIFPGKATGVLWGGNLSVLMSSIGTRYEPDWKGKILFIEDNHMKNYQIDRMFNQLQLAGVLRKIKGVVFGQCTDCENPSKDEQTLEDILKYYLVKNKVPSYMGADFGHGERNLTLPIGSKVEMDAKSGTIKILSSAISLKQ